MRRLRQSLLHFENRVHQQLVAHSIAVLRVALGAVFLGFGVLKYIPAVSPAEDLTNATTHLLTFGLVPDGVSIVVVATLECFIGLSLVAGRWMRAAIWLLAVELVGIMAPLALLPGRLFAGPHGAATLEGQYVLKDVILVGASLVVTAAAFRGGRLVRRDLPPARSLRYGQPLDAPQKLRLVLDADGDPRRVAELSQLHRFSEAEFDDWRQIARAGAERGSRA